MTMRTGTGTGTDATPQPVGKTCPHRKTERRDGKIYCKGCGRQLYL
jgi:hypothetical protein